MDFLNLSLDCIDASARHRTRGSRKVERLGPPRVDFRRPLSLVSTGAFTSAGVPTTRVLATNDITTPVVLLLTSSRFPPSRPSERSSSSPPRSSAATTQHGDDGGGGAAPPPLGGARSPRRLIATTPPAGGPRRCCPASRRYSLQYYSLACVKATFLRRGCGRLSPLLRLWLSPQRTAHARPHPSPPTTHAHTVMSGAVVALP
jgi:hypothetical protein